MKNFLFFLSKFNCPVRLFIKGQHDITANINTVMQA